ncbi:hypothetical protein L484_007989 [Morus notabilis]|uniref:C2 NT-type domain-containing protein n=1 Tax=Morus notabilis TaxID=981085 RepID=W9QT87_9ROSA|nr:hypothetical protein L484_007989 [Morus notabilis]
MFKFSGQIRSFSACLKHKSEKPQDRVEFKFKFPNFQAFQDNVNVARNTEECLFKLVVAMRSLRFGTLGEATVNLASYTDSKTCQPVQLELKKCDYGTVLQVTIQCLTLRTKLRKQDSYGHVHHVIVASTPTKSFPREDDQQSA